MASKGHSYAEIATQLNAESRTSKVGKPFSANFTDLLKNRKYIGEYVYNRSTAKSLDGKRNNHNNKAEFEIIRIPNAHPRIVDQQTFIKVQEILRRRQFRKGQPRLVSKYMLAGRIRCATCGRAFFGDVAYGGRNKAPRFRYLCGSKSTIPCQTKDLNMGSMDGFVKEFLHRYLLNTKMSKKWLEITRGTLENFKIINREKLKVLKVKALEKEKEIDNLIQKAGEARRNSERLIIEQIRSLDIEQANLSTEANALEIELSRLTRPTQKNITKVMRETLPTLKKDPQLIARKFIRKIVAGNSEVIFEFDLRHFAGVENLVFDIVVPVIVPRELIVKSKFLTWDYDFKQVNYRPKVESSRVRLQQDLNLIES